MALLLLRLSRLSLKMIRMLNQEQTAHEEAASFVDGINLTHILSMMKDHNGSGFKRRARQRKSGSLFCKPNAYTKTM